MLRPATEEDFGFIRSVAGTPANARFIDDVDEACLSGYLADPDYALVIWELGKKAEGFALFCERGNPANRLELRRLALAHPGDGNGLRFVEALRDYGFSVLGTDCLWLDVVSDNPRARHLYEKAGFSHEGRLRARWRRPAGDVADLDVLSMLRSEWHPRA
ncbi:GNAT family N-acetyltransferase [Tropicimonas sp. IMCC6043]|uniref:GNAT family N-acetyltransferase n=1 Tax=Tropicimonas sp. IMCC6043 TaxID=2510645 RepID=UPI00101D5F94|nr:GNAT family protein [Tropicimonas sp. IMCC6043]RYH10135.1 N-acetyltransferase [Tropicimonas sp. IMCC6043]